MDAKYNSCSPRKNEETIKEPANSSQNGTCTNGFPLTTTQSNAKLLASMYTKGLAYFFCWKIGISIVYPQYAQIWTIWAAPAIFGLKQLHPNFCMQQWTKLGFNRYYRPNIPTRYFYLDLSEKDKRQISKFAIANRKEFQGGDVS